MNIINRQTLTKLTCVLLFVANSTACSFITPSEPSDLPESSPVVWKSAKNDKYIDTSATREKFDIPKASAKKLPAPKREITPEVKKEMDRLLGQDNRSMAKNLDNGQPYMKTLFKIFSDEGVPTEMVYVAMIESGFNSAIRSPMGAAGLWQFMKSTAQLYGLKVNFFIDERKDIVLSTIAAARHLKDLYREYNDWGLVLAAYNSGSGTVDRAIRTHKQRDFWVLAKSGNFKMETVKFVAKFYAIISIMDNNEKYGRNFTQPS